MSSAKKFASRSAQAGGPQKGREGSICSISRREQPTSEVSGIGTLPDSTSRE